LGLIARVFQCVPQLVDSFVKAPLEIYIRAGRPYPGRQLFARNQLPGMLQKREQNLQRLVVEADSLALPHELARSRIKFESTEAESPG